MTQARTSTPCCRTAAPGHSKDKLCARNATRPPTEILLASQTPFGYHKVLKSTTNPFSLLKCASGYTTVPRCLVPSRPMRASRIPWGSQRARERLPELSDSFAAPVGRPSPRIRTTLDPCSGQCASQTHDIPSWWRTGSMLLAHFGQRKRNGYPTEYVSSKQLSVSGPTLKSGSVIELE